VKYLFFILLFFNTNGFSQIYIIDFQKIIISDSNLTKRITFKKTSTSIGELFEAIKTQADVNLIVNDKDANLSGERIAVFIQDKPIVEVMESISSLFSHKKALWYWKKTEEKNRFTYEIIRSPEAKAFDSTLYENFCNKLFDISENVIKDINENTLEKNKSEEKKIIKSDSDKMARRLYGTLLTKVERYNLIHGSSKGISIALNSVPQKDLEYIKKEHPNVTGFSVDYYSPYPHLSPFVFFNIESTDPNTYSQNTQGITCAGGPHYDAEFCDDLYHQWVHEGDSEKNEELEKRLLPELPDPWEKIKEEKKKNMSSLEYSAWLNKLPNDYIAQHIRDIAGKSQVSILCRLPLEQNDSLSSQKQTLGDILSQIQKMQPRRLFYKWRKDTLLISSPYWAKEKLETTRVPYTFQKQWKERFASKLPAHAPLAIEDVFVLCSQLSVEQITALNRYGKAQNEQAFQNLDRFVKLHSYFAMFAQRKDLWEKAQQSRGIGINQLPPAIVKRLNNQLGNTLKLQGASLKVRLKVMYNEPQKSLTLAPVTGKHNPPIRGYSLSIYLREANGNEQMIEGFSW
jgi:hypothetical protein